MNTTLTVSLAGKPPDGKIPFELIAGVFSPLDTCKCPSYRAPAAAALIKRLRQRNIFPSSFHLLQPGGDVFLPPESL